MNVLSLFNGMNTGRQALENVGINVNKYYSSEIKPYANKLTQFHFPDTIQLGNINNWKNWDINFETIDLILSGSPCQDLSNAGAGKQAGINGSRSNLFFVFVEILEHIKTLNPKILFLQENVASATKLDIGIMSRCLGVYPVRINSQLVTAQLRDRYYWSNIKTKKTFFDIETDIPQPKDLKIKFIDILENGTTDKIKCICLTKSERNNIYSDMDKLKKYIEKREKAGFTPCIHVKVGNEVRNLTKTEFCRLQGFPDHYCDILTKSKAVSLLGDGWTLPIIEHIFTYL